MGKNDFVNRFQRMTHAAVYGTRGKLAEKVERPRALRAGFLR